MGNKLVKSSSLAHYGIKGMEWGKLKKEDPVIRNPKTNLPVTPMLPPPVKQRSGLIPTWTSKQKEDRAKLEVQDDINNQIQDFSKIPRFDPASEPMDTALLKVNEGYAVNDSLRWNTNSFNNNCPSTTFAYELRRRGFDVEAGQTGGLSSSEIGDMWGISKSEMNKIRDGAIPPKTMAELTTSIKAMGPGARGFCVMSWGGLGTGSGHICSFEVDKKGNVVFLDAQTGKSSKTEKGDSDDNPANSYKSANEYFVIRVDNRKPNEKLIKDMVRIDDRQIPPSTKKVVSPVTVTPKTKKVDNFISDKVKKFVVDKTTDLAKKKALEFLTKNKGKSVK